MKKIKYHQVVRCNTKTDSYMIVKVCKDSSPVRNCVADNELKRGHTRLQDDPRQEHPES